MQPATAAGCLDAFALLREVSYLADVPSPALASLARRCDVACWRTDDVVVHAGSPQTHVLLLCRGAVGIHRRNAARDISFLLGRVVAPSFCGDMEYVAGVCWTATLRAEEPSVAVRMPNAAFASLLESSANFARRMYHDASIRHLLAHQSGQALALHTVETRLWRVLLDWAGQTTADHVRFGPPRTQARLAQVLGVHRRTVARALGPLIASGQIDLDDAGHIVAARHLIRVRQGLPRDLFGLSSRDSAPPSPLRGG